MNDPLVVLAVMGAAAAAGTIAAVIVKVAGVGHLARVLQLDVRESDR